jgi:hypothetical protein
MQTTWQARHDWRGSKYPGRLLDEFLGLLGFFKSPSGEERQSERLAISLRALYGLSFRVLTNMDTL